MKTLKTIFMLLLIAGGIVGGVFLRPIIEKWGWVKATASESQNQTCCDCCND